MQAGAVDLLHASIRTPRTTGWQHLLASKHQAGNAAGKVYKQGVGRRFSAEVPAGDQRATLERAPTITDDVRWDMPRRAIGAGRYGTVYRSAPGGWRGLTVAVKEERAQQMVRGKWDVSHLQEEAEMLESLRHPNLVMYLGSDLKDDDGQPPLLSIVTEFCSGGSLYEALHEGRAGVPGLSAAERIRCARQVGSAIQMLHSHRPNPIVHRDLTSANVMLTRSRDAKVGDFGLARTLKKSSFKTTWAGTPEYMAPEHWRGEVLTPSVDVFSYGVMLWELLTCQVPWGLASDYEILMAVHEGQRLQLPEDRQAALPEGWPSAVFEVIEGCFGE
jgi:sterile alpha motif and leucine zipper-containing kinase AZK